MKKRRGQSIKMVRGDRWGSEKEKRATKRVDLVHLVTMKTSEFTKNIEAL